MGGVQCPLLFGDDARQLEDAVTEVEVVAIVVTGKLGVLTSVVTIVGQEGSYVPLHNRGRDIGFEHSEFEDTAAHGQVHWPPPSLRAAGNARQVHHMT